MIRRMALVFCHVLLPYFYGRGFMEFRKRNRQQARERKQSDNKLLNSLQTFAAKHMENIQDFFKKYVHMGHLAIFYFVGSYYSMSKRITGIRYVSIRLVRYVCITHILTVVFHCTDIHSAIGNS